MKYGYKGVELKNLIGKYEHNVSNNTIKITFLDDSSYEVPFTEENEQLILDKMLEQAKARSESNAIQNAIQRRRIDFPLMMLKVSALMINSANNSGANSKESKIIYSVLEGLIAVTIVLDGVELKFISDEIKELKKYDIYLAIKDKLESKINCDKCNMTDSNLSTLNINTLDNYSLREIEKIRDALDKEEKWGQYFSKNNQDKVLAKRRGR